MKKPLSKEGYFNKITDISITAQTVKTHIVAAFSMFLYLVQIFGLKIFD